MQAQAQEKAKVLILVPVLTLKPFSRRNMRCYLYVCAHGAVKTRQVKNLLKKLHLSKLIALKNDFEEHVSEHEPVTIRHFELLCGLPPYFSVPDSLFPFLILSTSTIPFSRFDSVQPNHLGIWVFRVLLYSDLWYFVTIRV